MKEEVSNNPNTNKNIKQILILILFILIIGVGIYVTNNYNENNIKISYFTDDYVNTKTTQYYYKLDGDEKE